MKIETSDLVYGDVIQQFFFEEFPQIDCSAEVRFEALAKQVIGTKQRRNGPMPSPEVQVKIRDIIRAHDTINFFVPWGASKQADGMGLDLLEVCALKQLHSLQEGLRQYGKKTRFTFRLDNLTDRWLFGEGRRQQISDYIANFSKLINVIGFDDATPAKESDFTGADTFLGRCASYRTVFHAYLKGIAGVDALETIGWKGVIPIQQRKYYTDVYKAMYPHLDPDLAIADTVKCPEKGPEE